MSNLVKIKHKKPKPKFSVKETLAEIENFVHWCKATDENLAGFNALVSKHPGKSYIIGKVEGSLQPKYVLPIWMDIADPLQRPFVFNAIHKALYGYEMSTKELEDEMVCKSEDLQ